MLSKHSNGGDCFTRQHGGGQRARNTIVGFLGERLQCSIKSHYLDLGVMQELFSDSIARSAYTVLDLNVTRNCSGSYRVTLFFQ
jgi:hypothetical protein